MRLTRSQLNACTVRDFLLLSEGYKRSKDRECEIIKTVTEFTNIENWRQARFIAYMNYLNGGGKESIWKFYPLRNDPTDKDIEEAMQTQSNEDWDTVRNLIEAVKAQGIKV